MPLAEVPDFSFLTWTGRAFLIFALVPYFGWGIYTLRLRYRFHEELSIITEGATLAGVAALYFVVILLLGRVVANTPVLHIFSILGLIASGAALYGPMAISLISRVLVDFVMPPEPGRTHEPRYAPAEALERELDYEGALREYMAIARIFPREAHPYIQIAEMYVKLEQPEDAVVWFERSMLLLDSAERYLHVMNRACELYQRSLDKKHEAVRLMGEYLKKFPDSEFSESVRARIERLRDV